MSLRLKDKVLIKDGGFATQLSCHVGDKIDGDPLWSARANSANPKAVIQTHLDFLNHGADLILTNTYQASVKGYMEYLNLDKDQSIDLIKTTVNYAKVARQKYMSTYVNDLKTNADNNEATKKFDNANPLVIASIGPYGAHLHDGSEYSGSYADYVKPEVIQKWHRDRIDACVEAGVDALAIETIPCQIEAETVVDLLCDEYPDVKFWVSFQCKDGSSLAHGESFHDATMAIWEKMEKNDALHNLLAIGVNCLHPKFVTSLFKSVNGNRPISERIPLVVYPNSGEIYDVDSGWTGKEDCVPLEHYVPEWIELGAKIVGGCCRTYARDIRRIRNRVESLYIES